MLETKGIQIYVSFGFECEVFDILAAVLDQPLMWWLQKQRGALCGRGSLNNQSIFVLCDSVCVCICVCMWNS